MMGGRDLNEAAIGELLRQIKSLSSAEMRQPMKLIVQPETLEAAGLTIEEAEELVRRSYREAFGKEHP